MAVIVTVESDQMTPELYEELRKAADWEHDPPSGGVFHVVRFDDEGLHVTDVWESAEQFESFMSGRIIPAMASLGLTAQPKIGMSEAHAYWMPGKALVR